MDDKKNDNMNLYWLPDNIEDPSCIPTGDMPGDKVKINVRHITKAKTIFPKLLGLLEPLINNHPYRRAVVAVCGGSGVGKSEIASLLTFFFKSINLDCYTLSGDNYPHRIPKYNDVERLRIFRYQGIKGLIAHGQYSEERASILKELQDSGNDADCKETIENPWLSIYQNEGRSGLRRYLGTSREINFNELSDIITQFQNGASSIYLKRMGRQETELWYDFVDFGNKNILIIEWTHSNSFYLHGVDIPILLHSTPQETLEHRKARGRDNQADSAFTTMVLELEQELLISQAAKAKIIMSRSGELIHCDDLVKISSYGNSEVLMG